VKLGLKIGLDCPEIEPGDIIEKIAVFGVGPIQHSGDDTFSGQDVVEAVISIANFFLLMASFKGLDSQASGDAAEDIGGFDPVGAEDVGEHFGEAGDVGGATGFDDGVDLLRL
jgi:hypothetical protein